MLGAVLGGDGGDAARGGLASVLGRVSDGATVGCR